MIRASLRLMGCLLCCLAMQLQAATAADVQGEWVVNNPAAWESMKSNPPMAGKTDEQLKYFEGQVVPKFSNMKINVTADKFIMTSDTKVIEKNVLSDFYRR